MLMKSAIQDFKNDREFKNLSKNTINSYVLNLNELQKYCAEKEILNVEDISQNTIKSYLVHCKKIEITIQLQLIQRIKI